MQKYLINQHRVLQFDHEWLPHRQNCDTWRTQGIFHDEQENTYGFRLSVNRVQAGMESFCVVNLQYGKLDAEQGMIQQRWCIHALEGDKEGLLIDEDSILFRDEAQLLLAKDAIAMRLRGDDYALDLRMGRERPEVWFGEDGRIPFLLGPRRTRRGYLCTLPMLSCVGRIYRSDGSSSRVNGTASFERLWGRYPLRMSKAHWERFYLFMDNGDELSITAYPYGKLSTALCMPKNVLPFVFFDYQMEAASFLELEDWRFASAWRLDMPQYSQQVFYLSPIVPYFRLPAAQPILGVFDHNGNRLGYAFSELLPGARNEVDHVGLALFFREN